jgi:hypothetical protein
MTTDMFRLSLSQIGSFRIHDLSLGVELPTLPDFILGFQLDNRHRLLTPYLPH